MKNHIAFKFIAILLCACCLLVTAAGALGVVFLTGCDLYDRTPEIFFQDAKESRVWQLAHSVAQKYAAVNLGNCPESLAEQYSGYAAREYFPDSSKWFYTIADENGTVLESTYTEAKGAESFLFTLDVSYPAVLGSLTYQNGILVKDSLNPTTPGETFPQSETIEDSTENTLPQYHHVRSFGYSDGVYSYHYNIDVRQSPTYIVTVYLLPGGYTGDEAEQLVDQLWHYRYQLPVITAGALLLFAVLLVYLCCAAAKNPGQTELRPGGLNRLPLDLYAGIITIAAVFAVWFFLDIVIDNFSSIQLWLLALMCAAIGLTLSLLAVGFLFACAAQFKMGNFYWWKHSLVGMAFGLAWWVLRWCWNMLCRICRWLKGHLPSFAKDIFLGCVSLCKGIWGAGKKLFLFFRKLVCQVWSFFWNALKTCLGWLWSKLARFCQLLPLTWQWLLTAFFMALVLIFGIQTRGITALFLSLAICGAIVLYGTHAFGNLLESVKRMSRGDLESKVDDSLMIGSFKDFAGHLNDLAGVATVAAQKQMKSERMKAELVTNVSHDIKTPLTSIINYVDLLQKAESQEQAEEYLEVLSRQSQRIKKLIEDLVEMSKATTGNLHVDITQVDAGEAVNQALGEFADKLAAADLTPVFHAPDKPVLMRADGRLAWRVLSNLLSNAVKYALPGTRLYIDLVKLDKQVLISLKNISREELNVSSDELMERFVRGDASRNTEGSGLGLNIAKSLMDVQGGQLQLLIDGDLFKATLIFPSL